MYCTRCGTKLGENARFCTGCGARVGSIPEGNTAAETPLAADCGPVPAPARRLCRVVSRKKLAGVCAGFADYFETDVTLMRVIWLALLLLPPHIGLIAYLVSWAVLPKC